MGKHGNLSKSTGLSDVGELWREKRLRFPFDFSYHMDEIA